MRANGDIPVRELIEASCRPEVVEAMREFYAEVDRRIAEHNPTCWNRGACCRFGEYGHRLYVTALEVAYYLAVNAGPAEEHLRPTEGSDSLNMPTSVTSLPVLIPTITADVCPHAYEGKCHARTRRPLGCRVFYCDPNAQDWQGPLTEECLEELKRLHWELGISYFYADWMSVLRSLRDHRPGRD